MQTYQVLWKILTLLSEAFSDDNEHVSVGIAASSTFW